MKYLSKFGPPAAAIYSKDLVSDENRFTAYFYASIFATLFVMIWDFRVDWGLFGATKGYILRDPKEMKFPPRFYYTCIVFNIIFRFWWLIGIWVFSKLQCESYNGCPVIVNLEIATSVGMYFEAFRRTFWAMIRIENEFFHNFENYREIIDVPPIKDDNN